MVKEIRKNGEKIYQCESCKLFYKKRGVAKQCENWCRKYNSCNIDITKNAMTL